MLLDDTIRLFQYYKSLTDRAVEQVEAHHLHETPPQFPHSIAILMKHLSGNMISRWTRFRTEDGEKPWRKRDSEFIDDFDSTEALFEYWVKGWKTMLDALATIKPEELEDVILIRNERHTIHLAVQRQLAHIAYHTGQIILIARLYTGKNWKSLSIPKGKTEEYNRKKFSNPPTTGMYTDRD